MSGGSNVDKQTVPPTDAVDTIISLVFAIVFIMSGISHLENPYFSLGSVYGYNFLNSSVGETVAMVLPVLQLIVAVCLIARLYFDSAHCVTLILFASFATVQSLAWYHDLGISCGCFGPAHEMRIGISSLAMIYGLLLLSLVRNGVRLRRQARRVAQIL